MGHAVHWAAFWVSENRPDAQTAHVWSALFRRLPALHEEHYTLPLPAVRKAVQASQPCATGSGGEVSCSQSEQNSCPVRMWCLPGMHGRHDAELLSGWW